ncbi:hypothetical protein V8C37DRAFT_118126 [Trichoderma ceciliae]
MNTAPGDKRLAGEVPMDMRPKTPTKSTGASTDVDVIPPVTMKRSLGQAFKFDTQNGILPLKLMRKDQGSQLARALKNHLEEEEALWAAKRKMLELTAKALDSALNEAKTKQEKAFADILEGRLAPVLKELAVGGLENPPKIKRNDGNERKDAQAPKTTEQAAQKQPTRDRPVPLIPTRAATRPQQGAATWAEVAKDPHTQTISNKDWTVVGSKGNKGSGAKKAPPPTLRAYIRLPEEHPWRNMTAAGVRKEMASITGMSLARITEAKEVKTGWAIRVNNEDAMNYLMAPIPAYERHGLLIERDEEWHAYFIPRVPRTFRDLNGESPIDQMVANEAQAKSKAKEPPRICKAATNNPNSSTQDWVVVFRDKVKEGFRLFGTSGPAKAMHKSTSVHQCSNCLGFHDQGVCNREGRCDNCGDKVHGECTKPPQCTNCLGPHKSNSTLCKARPVTVKGKIGRPTKAQLKGIRKLGLASYNAAQAPSARNPKEKEATLSAPATGKKDVTMEEAPTEEKQEEPATEGGKLDQGTTKEIEL